MASSRIWHASTVAALLAVAACSGLKKTDAPAATSSWRTATVETVRSVRANAGESRSGRAGAGFLSGGLIGAAINTGAMDPKQGDTGAWEYALRDGETLVTVRSFLVVGPGDCVRYAANAAGDAVPLERLPPERCAVR